MKTNMLSDFKVVLSLNVGFVFLATGAVNANADTDPCGCNALLMQGVYSLRAEKGDSEARSDILHILVTKSWLEMRHDFDAGGGGSYAGYGISGSMSESEYNKKSKSSKQKIM